MEHDDPVRLVIVVLPFQKGLTAKVGPGRLKRVTDSRLDAWNVSALQTSHGHRKLDPAS